jgi:hypothetical protein
MIDYDFLSVARASHCADTGVLGTEMHHGIQYFKRKRNDIINGLIVPIALRS